MSHQLFPDVLTGQPSPSGTGLNLYRCGKIVFAGTLSEASLDRVLAFLATTPKCEPEPPKPPKPPKCGKHCFCRPSDANASDAVCCLCGERYLNCH